MSLITSIITGGSNNHETTSEEANFVATDFISEGVTGAITNTSGVAPATGSFAVNAQGTPDMTVAVSSGAAYVTATPTGQNSQVLRVRNTASENVTIAANSTGGTRYDWVYISIDADNAATPSADGTNVASLVTSRSTSPSTDNGTPPTYGYPIAVVTVANGASSITNANISDSRATAKIADTDDIADDAVTNVKVADTTITNEKMATANQELVIGTPGSNTDYSSGTWGDWYTVGNATVPTWSTKAFVSYTLPALPITASGDFEVRVAIGSDSGSSIWATFSSQPTGEIITVAHQTEITLTGTGTQSVKIQARRNAGTGGLRLANVARVTARIEYYP